MLHPTLQAQLPSITELFKANAIKAVYAFGSVVSDRFNDQSDVDLLISFYDETEPLEKGEIYWRLHDGLRQMLAREIDILIDGSLKNPYFIEELNETKELIYAA